MAVSNITNVEFGNLTMVETEPHYQYDYGQKLKFTDLNLPSSYEVHFANDATTGIAYTQLGDSTGVAIPNALFRTGKPIFAFIYLHKGSDDGKTVYVVKIPVRSRAKPSDMVVPSEEETSIIRDAIAALQAATEAVEITEEEVAEMVSDKVEEMFNDPDIGEKIGVLSIGDGTLERKKVDADFELTLQKADNSWQKSERETIPFTTGSWESIYDPEGQGKINGIDPYTYASNKEDEAIKRLRGTNNIQSGNQTFDIIDSQNTTHTYTGIDNALNGLHTLGNEEIQRILNNYKSFNIVIKTEQEMEELLQGEGEEYTFYLVPDGDNYIKYWYINTGNDNYTWDIWGGAGTSSTVVVTELPITGDPNVDYILSSNDTYQYYKYINNDWHLIAGNNSEIISYPSGMNNSIIYFGEGVPENKMYDDKPFYLDTSTMTLYSLEIDSDPQSGEQTYRYINPTLLVTNPNENKDYYILDNSNDWRHYRYLVNAFKQIGSNGYSKNEIDSKLSSIQSVVNTNTNNIQSNTTNISSLSQSIDRVAQDLNELDVEGLTYYATLTAGDNNTYTYTLYEVDGETETVKSQFVLPSTGGGGGGGGSTTTLTVEKITPSPVICTPTDSVILEINYSSVDSDGEQVDGTYVLKRGTVIVSSGNLVQGRNSFDVTESSSVGSQKYSLTVTDEGGSMDMKSWTVQIVDVRIESNFNDKYTFNAGSPVNFTYTPYGAISKTVHFKFDGVKLDPVVTASSGTLQSYTLPAQTHGTHLLECWITATVNSINIETDHIFKDIIWYNENATTPVIGCIYRYDYYGNVNAKQYDTTNIPYVVFNPKTSSPLVTLEVDGQVISNLRLSSSYNTWAYKTDDVGVHILKIICESTVVEIHMNIEELGYDISPVTGNLEFDFNPTGLSNSSEDRLWKDSDHPSVALSVSDNFDWDNGGYQLDESGNQYFCVKAGTRAYISYNLFAVDPKQTGAEFKTIFRTTNVRNKDAVFLTCLPDESETTVGLRMNVHEVNFYTSVGELDYPYSEEDIIEFEYNINILDLEDSNATSFVMTYEDGVATRALIYDATHRIYQYQSKPITIGSDDCDVHIYRMKAYSAALTDTDILKNFIADARDSETMINRYERNQIYDENNALTPESVALACPDLRVIKIESPHFTNDKKDYVKYTNVECIYKNGDPIYDNWKYVNGYHAGQGTTSNRYGLAGRNIDIIFGFDGVHQPVSKIDLDPTYITELTLGDGTKYSDGSGKVSLTRSSVPNDWFNIKVNIASSENANNALLQKRYNDYLPYQTPAMRRDSKIKNSMEFQNCVIFIKESDPDVTTHREFADTEWHFYGIGNIGDSKKTDNTRVNDPTDMKEFVVEISDNTLPNSTFDTGVYSKDGVISYEYTSGCSIVYPITQAQWTNANNTKHTSLYDNWDGTFEFRYDMGTKDGESFSDDEIEAQQELSKQVFRNMYEFVIMSSDSDFVNHLSDWFIVESPLYWYLFTERYTMTDNRSKNSFWHWGKTYITTAEAQEMGDDAQYYTIDDTAAAINEGYRFDLWDYDNDTALGIDNNGELRMTYGYEDIDILPNGQPVFNASESVFWRRIRNLMNRQLRAMYTSRESLNCWSASSLITEFDAWQEQFPEELWRLDIERKYLRTYYTGNPVAGIEATNDFLKNMMNGRKKYQRRQFERNQEIYIGTKYFGMNQCADSLALSFRCNTPQNAVVAPNYTLRVVPYSDMYLTVAYGNSSPTALRAKAGVEYTFTTDMQTMDDTQVLIYCAENIMALNDLSAFYIRANNFAYGKRLKTLIIGSNVTGYSNPFITSLGIGANTLLETLDIRNCPNLTGTINLSSCTNLETLLAEGTSVSSITFAPNGNIESAHLPETVSTLSFRNIKRLTDLQVASYDNLETFICEYSDIDALSILQSAADTLQTVRILGIDWTLSSTDLLNACLDMNSSLLTGSVYISGTIRNQEINNYTNAWSDLTVDYNIENLISQYKVTYVNADEDHTVLYTVYVDQGDYPPDPYNLGLIDKPSLPSTAQYIYVFNGWTGITSTVIRDTTIVASYEEVVQKYTVRFFARANVLLETKTDVPYGSEVIYEGETPTWSEGEVSNIYRLFAGWDKNTGFIKKDTDFYAKWNTCNTFPEIGTNMKDMTPSELYAIGQANLQDDYWEEGDYVDVTLVENYSFSDVRECEIGKDVKLDGIQVDQFVSGGYYFDGTTAFTTNIKLFEADSPAFTMAIDFQFNGSATGQTLISSHKEGLSTGFRLYYNGSNPTLQWGDQSVVVGYQKQRDIVVIRHPKGSRYLYVYAAGNNSTARFAPTTTKTILLRSNTTETNEPLTFGGIRYPTNIRNYGVGTLHWCKIWYEDLGETIAYNLALFPREKHRLEYWGAGKYYYANTDTPCKASFIFNEALGGIHGRYLRMNNAANINEGGWEACDARDYLNNRFFYSFSLAWQSLIKAVEIKATSGSQATEILTSIDKIYIPSLRESGSNTTASGYIEEVGTSLAPIPWFTNNLTRVKFQKTRKYDGDPTLTVYSCQQEPSLLYQTSIDPGSIWVRINVDNRPYIFLPQEELDQYGIVPDIEASSAYAIGGWITAYYWWLRSPSLSASTAFAYVAYTGGVGSTAGATANYVIVPCLSF